MADAMDILEERSEEHVWTKIEEVKMQQQRAGEYIAPWGVKFYLSRIYLKG